MTEEQGRNYSEKKKSRKMRRWRMKEKKAAEKITNQNECADIVEQ